MWAHGANATVLWWMWVLMGLATVGLWVLVACVLRMVLTRPWAALDDTENPDRLR